MMFVTNLRRGFVMRVRDVFCYVAGGMLGVLSALGCFLGGAVLGAIPIIGLIAGTVVCILAAFAGAFGLLYVIRWVGNFVGPLLPNWLVTCGSLGLIGLFCTLLVIASWEEWGRNLAQKCEDYWNYR